MTISGGRWNGPIWDTHLHLDLEARGLSAAQDFSNAGGTHICLVHKPSFASRLPQSIEQVDQAYRKTLDLAAMVRERIEIILWFGKSRFTHWGWKGPRNFTWILSNLH